MRSGGNGLSQISHIWYLLLVVNQQLETSSIVWTSHVLVLLDIEAQSEAIISSYSTVLPYVSVIVA